MKIILLSAFLTIAGFPSELKAQTPGTSRPSVDLLAKVAALEQEIAGLRLDYQLLLASQQVNPAPATIAPPTIRSAGESRPQPPRAQFATALAESSDSGAASRQEAMSSLLAMQTVLGGASNTIEFHTFYLRAKAHVDALPDVAENAPLREVTSMYEDAGRLFTAAENGEMPAADVRYFKQKYSAASAFSLMSLFGDVPDKGFGQAVSRSNVDNQIWVRATGSALLDLTDARLASLK